MPAATAPSTMAREAWRATNFQRPDPIAAHQVDIDRKAEQPSTTSTTARWPRRAAARIFTALAQRVTDTAHRLDEARPTPLLELVAQVGDVGVDDVRATQIVSAPHAAENLVAVEHLARVAQKKRQQIELARGQVEELRTAPGLARDGIERQIGVRQALAAGARERHGGAGRRCAPAAPRMQTAWPGSRRRRSRSPPPCRLAGRARSASGWARRCPPRAGGVLSPGRRLARAA